MTFPSFVFLCLLTTCFILFRLLTLCQKQDFFILSCFYACWVIPSCISLFSWTCLGKSQATFKRFFGEVFLVSFLSTLPSLVPPLCVYVPWWSLCVYILYCTRLFTCLSCSVDFREHHFFLVISTILGMWKAIKKWLLSEWTDRGSYWSILNSHIESICGIYSFFMMIHWWYLHNQFKVIPLNRGKLQCDLRDRTFLFLANFGILFSQILSISLLI